MQNVDDSMNPALGEVLGGGSPGRPTSALRRGVSSTTSMISVTKSFSTWADTEAGSRSLALKSIASHTVVCKQEGMRAQALINGLHRPTSTCKV